MRQTLSLTLSAFAAALFLGGTKAAPAQDYRIGTIQISHPWAPPTSDSTKDAPGYLTITNTGSVPDRLISGSFIDASHLEVHSASGAGGKAKMTRVDGLVINPGETIVLKPGGDHLMFIDLKGPLQKGMSAQSILRFERAGAGMLEFAVEGAAPRARSAAKPKPAEKSGEKAPEQSAHAHGQ